MAQIRLVSYTALQRALPSLTQFSARRLKNIGTTAATSFENMEEEFNLAAFIPPTASSLKAFKAVKSSPTSKKRDDQEAIAESSRLLEAKNTYVHHTSNVFNPWNLASTVSNAAVFLSAFVNYDVTLVPTSSATQVGKTADFSKAISTKTSGEIPTNVGPVSPKFSFNPTTVASLRIDPGSGTPCLRSPCQQLPV